jgi:hypothetical protein
MRKEPAASSKGASCAFENVNRQPGDVREERAAEPPVSFRHAGIHELVLNTLAAYIGCIGIADER